ncbi:MAG: hypothetical protein HXS52_12690 [Theionarchaea archaeon]|nr:hypothetical protein [Theionarchaea archaeon]
MRIVYGLIISIVLMLSCIGQNPCEDVTCGNVCRGEALWKQTCINGECVDARVVEENSPMCGYDPCRDVVCDNACISTELWKMTCLNGECVSDHLIEENSESCGYSPPPSSTPPPSDKVLAEEYRVNSALIEKGFDLIVSCFRDYDQIEVIVIEKYTSTGVFGYGDLSEALEWVRDEMPSVTQEMIDDFIDKNGKSYPLEDSFDIRKKVLLLEPDESREIFKDSSGWSEFYSRYPDAQGILTLSRVGFNADMSKALVYLGGQCDWLFGAGFYVLLVKKDGEWSIQGEIMSWIS